MSTTTAPQPAAPTRPLVETMLERHIRTVREAATERAAAAHLAYLSRFAGIGL